MAECIAYLSDDDSPIIISLVTDRQREQDGQDIDGPFQEVY